MSETLKRIYAPRTFFLMLGVMAVLITSGGVVLLAVLAFAPATQWYWPVLVAVLLVLAILVSWMLALAGIWVTPDRIIVVNLLGVESLDPDDVQEVGIETAYGGLMTRAYIRTKKGKLPIAGIRAYGSPPNPLNT